MTQTGISHSFSSNRRKFFLSYKDETIDCLFAIRGQIFEWFMITGLPIYMYITGRSKLIFPRDMLLTKERIS